MKPLRTRAARGALLTLLGAVAFGPSAGAASSTEVTTAFVSDAFGDSRAPSLVSVLALHPRTYFIIGDWDHSNPGGNLLANRPDLALTRARSFMGKLLDRNRGAFALDYRPLHDSGIPAYRVMDDHEVNNDASNTFEYWRQFVQALGEAYPPARDNGFKLGYDFQSVQIDRDLYILMDLRTHRENRPTNGKSILGNDGVQKAWLSQKFAQCATSVGLSAVRWCILVSTVPINPRQPKQDSWSGYPADRAWLNDQIVANGVRNIVVVSGDCHWGSIALPPSVTLPELNIPQTNAGFSNTCSNQANQWTLNSSRPAPGYGTLTLGDTGALMSLRDANGSVRFEATVPYRP